MASLPVRDAGGLWDAPVRQEAPGHGIDRRAATLRPVPLQELQEAALLDRVDTKFVCSVAEVEAILDQVGSAYGILTIEGCQSFRYRTTYYDDAGYRCFRDHLAGRPVRAKVRVRRYLDAGQAWMEVKQRNAAGRTRKLRVPLDAAVDPWAAPEHVPTVPADLWHGLPHHLDPAALRPILDVSYLRSTMKRLDDATRPERVTLDRAVAWSTPAHRTPSAAAVIVELKQAAREESPWRIALRGAGVRPTAVSNYCVGMAALGLGTSPPALHRMLTRLREPEQAVPHTRAPFPVPS